MSNQPSICSVHQPYPLLTFNRYFSTIFHSFSLQDYSHIVLCCIGSDRSTGDSLGPLVGSKLQHLDSDYIRIVGTLKETVHAKNLSATLAEISQLPNPLVIAIDACLGNLKSVGNILIHPGPLKPGSGVNKDLPPVGDISISAIVNIQGFGGHLTLQNTALSLVMDMADLISRGLMFHLYEIKNQIPLTTKRPC